jgi:hypothetical protein
MPARAAEPKLSPEWIREIDRRARESRDPVRYALASEFGRKFILYYDASEDVFVMNSPEKATLFKLRKAAERVSSLLCPGIRIVKFTTAGGSLIRLSPYQGPSWARKRSRSRLKRRRGGGVARSRNR